MIRAVASSHRCAAAGMLIAIASCLPATLRAQNETPAAVPQEHRVLQATPVGPPPSEPPVARAVPFDSPTPPPVPAPAPIQRHPAPDSDAAVNPAPSPPADGPELAQARRTVKSPPAPEEASSAPAGRAQGDDSTDIRLAPQAPGGPAASPDAVQFNLANDFYVRKDFTQAAAEYERYLGEYPDGPQRQAALWWLGEAYRTLQRTPAARTAYQNLAIAFKEGEFVGPACFRLGTIDFNDKDYRTAMPLFQRSAALAKADDVRLSSLYFQAYCLEKLDRRDETRPVYEAIVSVASNNPYRDDARLALARLAVGSKRFGDAFTQYEALSREAAKPALQAEASLKAALLARDLNQNDTAATLLTRATTLPGASAAVRAGAIIAQLHLFYDTNKYRQLLDCYAEAHLALPDALQPEAMLLAANAARQMGQHAKAQDAYDAILAQYPKSPQAPEARYERIISLYASNDVNFVHDAEEYLDTSPDPAKGDQVRLMKADTLFRQPNYAQAADAYSLLDGSRNLQAKYKAEVFYRLGYCYSQLHDSEKAASTFTRFLRAYPDHPFAVKALIQRAVAYQQLKNYPDALKDYGQVIEGYKDAREREVALEQKALILGEQGNDKEMTEAFQTLLKDYPKTDAAGLANFYIGRSAFAAADYSGALRTFEIARKADPKEYGAKAGLLMILCEYQLKDKAKLAADVLAYRTAKSEPPIPAEILRWLGEQQYEAKDYANAESQFAAATASPGNQQPDTWLLLARTGINLKNWEEALDATRHYLDPAPSAPAARAQGLLAQGEAQIGLRHYDEAQKCVDETLLLQPEGTLNAKARLLGGRVLSERGDYNDAAKAFMSVSVLYDDPQITPQALALAAEAFGKAGKAAEATQAADELKSRFPTYTANSPAE